MPPKHARRMDRLEKEIEEKYKPELQNNNPIGNNQYTKKEDMVKADKVLSEMKVFKKLNQITQKEQISNLGNEIWREGKALKEKKCLFTKMKDVFFDWDFKD